MLYAALTFWLSVIVLTAWGVHRLWSSMVQAKVINAILLPGTLVAQLGHALAVLVTGATISNTTLFKSDDSGDPESTPNPEPRIPIIGPVVLGMLPLVACATGIYVLADYFAGSVVTRLGVRAVGPMLPTTLDGFWQLLRDQISLTQSFLSAICVADYDNLNTWIFFYLLVCLSVRIAPFPGNLRGSLVAILLLGAGAALAASLFDVADPRVQNAWSVLNLTVAVLLLLLLTSLLARGAFGLVQVFKGENQS